MKHSILRSKSSAIDIQHRRRNRGGKGGGGMAPPHFHATTLISQGATNSIFNKSTSLLGDQFCFVECSSYSA